MAARMLKTINGASAKNLFMAVINSDEAYPMEPIQGSLPDGVYLMELPDGAYSVESTQWSLPDWSFLMNSTPRVSSYPCPQILD
jgi:hypothetical protein